MKNNDVIEIDLLQVWNVIKKNIIMFIAICILTCTAGFAYSKFMLDETYTATTKIIILKDESNGATSGSITSSDLSFSQRLTSTYTQIIKSEAIAEPVIDNLDLLNRYGITPGAYNSMVSVGSVNSTEVMEIGVTSTDPQLCADMANEIIDVFMDKVYDMLQIQNITILSRAKVPTGKTGPSYTKYIGIGGLIGLLICAAIVVLKILTDTKIKNEDQVKEIFPDYPIIGIIPNFEVKEDSYNE